MPPTLLQPQHSSLFHNQQPQQQVRQQQHTMLSIDINAIISSNQCSCVLHTLVRSSLVGYRLVLVLSLIHI